jgi:hypothetical protein
MTEEQPGTEHQERMAFDAHLAHYEAVRNDINLATTLQNNLVNYSIAALGGIIAAFTLVDAQNFQIDPRLYLGVSFLFSMMTWAGMETEIRIHDYHSFINQVLCRKINHLVKQPGEAYQVFGTELAGKSFVQKVRTVIRGILGTGKFLVSYLPAVLTLILYIRQVPAWSGRALFWITAAPLLFVPLVILFHALYVAGYYWKENAELPLPPAE